MNVLAIGNSFSEDATRYLHQIARADKENITVVNLYIGGCSLSRHYRNMLSGERAYDLQVNGQKTGFKVSLGEALLNRDWDYVSFQQVSGLSPDYDSYQPYLSLLSDYVRECAPKAKQLIHQVWGYENGSEMLINKGFESQAEMTEKDVIAYNKAAEDIGAEFVIPSGEIMLALSEGGFGKVHRDTFHASLGCGRYALGLTWYRKLTGNSVYENTFCDFDEEVTKEQIDSIKSIVMKNT